MSGGRKKAAPRATHQPTAQGAPGIPAATSTERGKSARKKANARARALGVRILSAKRVRDRIAATRAARDEPHQEDR